MVGVTLRFSPFATLLICSIKLHFASSILMETAEWLILVLVAMREVLVLRGWVAWRWKKIWRGCEQVSVTVHDSIARSRTGRRDPKRPKVARL